MGWSVCHNAKLLGFSTLQDAVDMGCEAIVVSYHLDDPVRGRLCDGSVPAQLVNGEYRLASAGVQVVRNDLANAGCADLLKGLLVIVSNALST